MAERIVKLINFEVKNINLDERTFDAVASTESVDRDGDIIRSSGWKLTNFKKNPVILWAHDYQGLPIAKALKIRVENNQLIFTPKFATKEQNPLADQVFNLYTEKFLNAFSVGFIPKKWKEMESEDGTPSYGREFTEQDLLEISGCPVPSNPEALIQAAMKAIELAKTSKIEKEGGTIEDEIRSGRVISEKNRTLIKSCVEQMGGAITSLNELLTATAEPEPEPQQESQGDVLIKVLQEIGKCL